MTPHGSVMHAGRSRLALVSALAAIGLLTLGALGAWTFAPAVQKSAASVQKPGAVALKPDRAVPPNAAGAMVVLRTTKIFSAPTGNPVGTLAQGAIVQHLARERGWSHVRVDGWVKETDVSPADSSFAAGLSAADLRANPEGTRGKVVRWEVQVLSLQIADALRSELGRDEPYLLAKGPGSENALLYLAIPPSLLADAKAVSPLTTVIITARVRSGRSEPAGTPILELKSIVKR